MKKIATIVLLLLSFAGSAAAGVNRGILKVEFLYSIEYAGGRSDRLHEPVDIFFDRKKGEFYVVDGAVDKIYVYDGNGMFIQEIRLQEKASVPANIAVDGEGRIYVSYGRNAKVSMLDYKGEAMEDLKLPGVLDLPESPVRALSLRTGRDGAVYALKSTGTIVKIDPENVAHRELSLTGEGGPTVISGMAVAGDGNFLFTDMRPYSVALFDTETRKYKRIGTPGVLYGQLARPQGITTDEAGHIFVVSSGTGKVSIFDREGTFIEEFGEFGSAYGEFYMASKIASDGKDRIFVLENTLKRIQVFKVEFLKEKEVAGPAASAKAPGKES